jgi:hypothetical protein
METNKKKLVMQSVQGKISHPLAGYPYKLDRNGNSTVLPATGGINYNVKVGDICMGLMGDHVEPGVSIKTESGKENAALNLLSCIGNEARVMSGEAKGAKGVVTGSHGGIDHVLIHFDQQDLEKMGIGDKILIRSHGQGLQIQGYEDVFVMNVDPGLLEKLGIEEKEGVLEIPVAKKVPAFLMGSGIGSPTAASGDYDITTGDKEALKQYDLENLRFGDIVLLEDSDNTYGREYLKGAVSIGVVIHSDCVKTGHGPGVSTILSAKTSKIKGRLDPKANIANYLELSYEK